MSIISYLFFVYFFFHFRILMLFFSPIVTYYTSLNYRKTIIRKWWSIVSAIISVCFVLNENATLCIVVVPFFCYRLSRYCCHICRIVALTHDCRLSPQVALLSSLRRESEDFDTIYLIIIIYKIWDHQLSNWTIPLSDNIYMSYKRTFFISNVSHV